MNFTMPCALIVVDGGAYARALSSVVTVGMLPGGQVRARTLGPAASTPIGASGVVEELPHAASSRPASDVQTRMVGVTIPRGAEASPNRYGSCAGSVTGPVCDGSAAGAARGSASRAA